MERQDQPVIQIGSRTVGGEHPLFVIAEVGTSHGGDFSKACALIDAAVQAGADCVKFQHVIASEIIHPLTGTVPLPGGNIPLFTRFQELEVGIDFFARCKTYTEEKEAVFLCTPFGLESARQLETLHPAAFKIASPELNHFPLLREIKTAGAPVLLSTGVATLDDIALAVEITGDSSVLLHCITAYPAPEEEYNLNVLAILTNRFGVPVGVSDHSLDPILVPALAAAAGGAVLEKHITLANDDTGLDDPIALTPDKFREMTAAVWEAQTAGLEKTVEKLSSQFGWQRVKKVLGDGEKRLASAEETNYYTTKRSIHAVCPIPAGEAFSEANTALLRTEKVLNPGLFPQYWPSILGNRALRDIPDGRGITWDDVER